MGRIVVCLAYALIMMGCKEKNKSTEARLPEQTGASAQNVRFMTLDPGHFHAALVQKTMYPSVDSTIYVYAPEGPEVQDFLKKIESYNNRKDDPTAWKVKTYLGEDYLQKMIQEKPGNVMVVAGKNSKKMDYVLAAVRAGINVYADKPLAIDLQGYGKLKNAFSIAREKGLILYDIMTERFEVTTRMQKLLSGMPMVFGELVTGTLEAPAISKESVHHFYKYVSGSPLVRPPWFFDVNEEGEGIVDVTTHLVDLVQWEAFPEAIIDTSDIRMIKAKHWPTVLSLDQFREVTGIPYFPDYLDKDVKEGKLNVFCNGEMDYVIRGKHARVSVIWNYKAPEGTGDTHYSIMRGSLANLVIRQGEAEHYKPTLYIEALNPDGFDTLLQQAIAGKVNATYPGTTVEKVSENVWKVVIPDRFKVGHEAHFAQVTENYLRYLAQGSLPDWEVPDMIAKYYTTTKAYEMANENP